MMSGSRDVRRMRDQSWSIYWATEDAAIVYNWLLIVGHGITSWVHYKSLLALKRLRCSWWTALLAFHNKHWWIFGNCQCSHSSSVNCCWVCCKDCWTSYAPARVCGVHQQQFCTTTPTTKTYNRSNNNIVATTPRTYFIQWLIQPLNVINVESLQ
jgi:hypothetical protein